MYVNPKVYEPMKKWSEPIKRHQIGWVWRVTAQEGEESATHRWVAQNKDEAKGRMEYLYPRAVVVACEKECAAYNDSGFLFMPLEGYIYET